MYWIRERESIRKAKAEGQPRPWSFDPVFQTTYFCNVRREDDKVTRWIRKEYGSVRDNMFEYNIILSRFLNWPETLAEVGYIENHDPAYVSKVLNGIRESGDKVWGNAYVVTTHGIPMDKIDYLCERVLPSIWENYGAVRRVCGWPPIQGERPCLKTAWEGLQAVEGLASFMAAQVVADLKNSGDHALTFAHDWRTFVAPGPGSLRGASWFMHGTAEHLSPRTFKADVKEIREYVESYIPPFADICNQDLQNCLCEYDKYMRVRNGTGRSKRHYNGL